MFKIHHKHYFDEDILCLLQAIICKENRIMATMQEILDHLSQQSTVEDQILQKLKDAQAASDPVAFQNVIDQIDANTSKLSAAMTVVTPAPVDTPPAQ